MGRHRAVGRSPRGNDRASAKWFSKVQSLTPALQKDIGKCMYDNAIAIAIAYADMLWAASPKLEWRDGWRLRILSEFVLARPMHE